MGTHKAYFECQIRLGREPVDHGFVAGEGWIGRDFRVVILPNTSDPGRRRGRDSVRRTYIGSVLLALGLLLIGIRYGGRFKKSSGKTTALIVHRARAVSAPLTATLEGLGVPAESISEPSAAVERMRALAFGALVLDDSLPNGGSLEVFGSLDDLGENRPTVVMITVPRATLAEAQKHTPDRLEYVATPESESDTERLALRVRSRLMNGTLAEDFDVTPQPTEDHPGLSVPVPEDFPVRSTRQTRVGSAVLALGLILLGAWYVFGTGAPSVNSRDQQARLVPTAQIEAQRPMAVPTSLSASTPVTTSAQADPSPTATRTQRAVRPASMSRQSNDARVEAPTPTVHPASTPPSTNTPVSRSAVNQRVVADPVRFVVDTPAIKVNAPVEYVGLTAERAMEVPKGWWNVGWYERGPKPGEQGNAVIAGHLDSESGPAVFWQLDKIRVGDEVRVVDVQGSTIRFRVREIQVYYNEDAPLAKIFGHTDGAHLNLITCDGFFDRNAGIYDRRLVVYTDRVG